jgi:hypothetical protein
MVERSTNESRTKQRPWKKIGKKTEPELNDEQNRI